MKLKNRLRELRLQHKLTQEGAANIIGVSKSTYIKYERGEREPKFITLFAIANEYKVSVDYLLGKSDEENRDAYAIHRASRFVADKELFKTFGPYEDAVTKLTAKHMGHLHNLDFDFLLDLFYMMVNIEDALYEVYSDGLMTFCYDEMQFKNIDIVPPPDESSYLELNDKVGSLRKLMDGYIHLLLSPEFYKTGLHDYYFSRELLDLPDGE